MGRVRKGVQKEGTAIGTGVPERDRIQMCPRSSQAMGRQWLEEDSVKRQAQSTEGNLWPTQAAETLPSVENVRPAFLSTPSAHWVGFFVFTATEHNPQQPC